MVLCYSAVYPRSISHIMILCSARLADLRSPYRVSLVLVIMPPPEPSVEARGPNGRALAVTDITQVSPLLESIDPLSQSEIAQGLLLQDGRLQLGPDADFAKHTVRRVRASVLKRNFDLRDRRAAMQLLKGRTEIVLDADDIWEHDDPEVSFSPYRNHLDLHAAVARESGLDAIMPNDTVNHNYCFDFTVNQRHKAWKAKYVELGFSPNGRMLHIGKVQGQNVWLAFPPLEFWDLDSLNLEYDEDSNEANTLLPTDRYRKVVYLLAYLFSIAGIAGVTNLDNYSRHLSSQATHGWKVDTNIL